MSAPAAPLRILQVFNQYLDAGGEELWVDHMAMMGDAITEFEDLRFYSRSWKSRGAPGFFKQALWLGNHPAARALLREEVARFKPDALVFHNVIPVGSLGLYSEATELGIPIIHYIHNFRPFSPSGTMWFNDRINPDALKGRMWPEVLHACWEGAPLRTAILAFHLKQSIKSGLLEKIDRWVAISDFMKTKFIEAGVPESKIVKLRHCWKMRLILPPAPESDHYLFLGRLVPEKGVGSLIDAWQLLESQLGKSCPRLIIAGTGPQDAKLRAMARNLKSVSFVGFVSGEKKDSLLRSCRSLLAPSIWWEPLGLIVYEAYDFQRPVIAANSGGLSETVHPGKTGFLHEPGDPEAIANAVLACENLGVSGRASLGVAGRAWLGENASPEQWLVDFRKMVCGLLNPNLKS
jgi:glycosyltransferase involved in cell wall biosynthesis